MMKKKSFFFASFNILFPPVKTTAVDRTTGTLKKMREPKIPIKTSPNIS